MPVPIVNGGGDRFWKWKEFKLSRARDLDLDLGSGHTAYRHASFINLYLYSKFHSNRRNFLWTDGRTDVRTYRRTDIFSPLILLGRLLEVDLKMIYYLAAKGTSRTRPKPAAFKVKAGSPKGHVLPCQGHRILSSRTPALVLSSIKHVRVHLLQVIQNQHVPSVGLLVVFSALNHAVHYLVFVVNA